MWDATFRCCLTKACAITARHEAPLRCAGAHRLRSGRWSATTAAPWRHAGRPRPGSCPALAPRRLPPRRLPPPQPSGGRTAPPPAAHPPCPPPPPRPPQSRWQSRPGTAAGELAVPGSFSKQRSQRAPDDETRRDETRRRRRRSQSDCTVHVSVDS